MLITSALSQLFLEHYYRQQVTIMWFGKRRDQEKEAGQGGDHTLHQKEKQDFHRLLSQTGERLPDGGEQVLDCFMDTEGHVSPEYIKGLLASTGHDIDIETIKEVLEVLCRYGIAQRTHLNGTGQWFEHLHIGRDHDHLLCTNCGAVVEFVDNELTRAAEQAARSRGFKPACHKVTILGLCPKCMETTAKVAAMPLSLASPGERVKVVEFTGGDEVKRRLSELGLLPGEEVTVVNKLGPVIVSLKGARIAIGKGLAQKVMVTPLS